MSVNQRSCSVAGFERPDIVLTREWQRGVWRDPEERGHGATAALGVNAVGHRERVAAARGERDIAPPDSDFQTGLERGARYCEVWRDAVCA